MVISSLECECLLNLGKESECCHQLKNVLKYFETNNYKSDLYFIYSYLMKYYSAKNQLKKLNEYYLKRERLEYV